MLPDIVPVAEDKRPALITEHGRAAAILFDVGSCEELTKRADILDRMIQLQPEITKTMTTIWTDIAKAMWESFGLKRRRTQPCRPRTNGKAERFIQTLLREWAYGRTWV